MGGCLTTIVRMVINTVIARAVSKIAEEIIRRLTGARLTTRWIWALLAVLGLGGIRRISNQRKN